MTKSDSIVSKLSLAIRCSDDLSADKNTIGELSVETLGFRKPVIMNPLGYFLFLDIPEGNSTVKIQGHYYTETSLAITCTQGKIKAGAQSINPNMPLMDLPLSPKALYPFPAGMTIVKGKVVNAQNDPVIGTTVSVNGRTENGITEADGGFYISFPTMTSDTSITLTIPNAAPLTLTAKKGSTVEAGTIQLSI